MNKIDFQGGGTLVLCDKCRRIISVCTGTLNWEMIYRKPRTEGATPQRLDFCDERCRTIFFRGKKYWSRKLDKMAKNGVERDYEND